MSDVDPSIDWGTTTFDGSRRQQLRQAQAMTVRQRLEALDDLTELSDRLQAMSRRPAESPVSAVVHEPSVGYRTDTLLRDVVLPGCTPTPLANYLKALGVLRLLSARYPETRGFWRGECFVLRTELAVPAIEQFLLQDYAPTPIIAPWNGGSGFFCLERKTRDKDPRTGKRKGTGTYDQQTAGTKVVDAIFTSTGRRFEAYRQAIQYTKRAIARAGLVTAPDSGTPKDDFILHLRATLPDECIEAMDAGLVVTGQQTRFPPLLGSGWNDGNMDFTSNFMQRLVDVLGTDDDAAPNESPGWLHASLFGTAAANLTSNSIGQFSPGQAGGPNATAGYEGHAAMNPWDFVLMIEGVLAFAAATVRRNASDEVGALSYPFTVRVVGAGSGSLGQGDSATGRGELWMPLWRGAATYAEIRALLSEGRVALGRKPARDALDFVRAVQRLGSYRGIGSFQRFGFLQRAGRSYLATPLSRVEVSDRARSRWLDDLDRANWLERFRQFARGEHTATRFKILSKRLEDSLFSMSGREGGPVDVQALLRLLGEVQTALSNNPKAQEVVRPVSRLSEEWVQAADDGRPAFRITKALAGLRGVGDAPLPIRAQLFPLHRKYNQWAKPGDGELVRICTGHKGRLVDTLCMLLERRLWLAEKLEMRDKPLGAAAGATLDDISAFLRDDAMDELIATLLPGLALCDIPRDAERRTGDGVVPAAFGVLKLSLTPDSVLRSLRLLRDGMRVSQPAGMLAQLAAGNVDNRAVKSAWRKLRASGLTPLVAINALPAPDSISPLRACAALLIPLRYSATAALARDLLEAPSSEAITV